MTSSEPLTGPHLRTYQSLFEQPAPLTLDWCAVRSLLGRLGHLAEDSNGTLKAMRNGQIMVLHSSRTQEAAGTLDLMTVRKFLTRSEMTPPDASEPAADSMTAPDSAEADPLNGVVFQLQQSEIFRDYRDAFEATTGLPLALRLAGSFQTPLHGSKRLNPFCALMGRSNKSCAACLQLQQRVEDQAVHEPKTLECFAGLSESAVPVRVGSKLVGYLQTGQVFLRAPTRARFNDVMRGSGPERSVSELEALETAYFQTRVLGKKQYDPVIRLLAIFAKHLAALSNEILLRQATAEFPAITKVRAFIAKHQGEVLNLGEVARSVNMSKFYFCKLFKLRTGLTFTHYLARMRIESVKRMLNNVHMRVSEAAYASGFQSLSQFNRVFRRVTGESPSDFRGRLHGQPTQTGGPVRGASGRTQCAGTSKRHLAVQTGSHVGSADFAVPARVRFAR